MNIKQLLLAGSAVLLAADIHAQVIFGTVRTTAGVPIDGVLVRATRAFPFERFNTTTDFSGGYVVGSGLSGAYTVEAMEATYTFTPASANVTVSGSSQQVNFTSPSTVPTATTSGATNVTATGATLRGSVNPNGTATTAHIEYGLTASYGSVSGSVSVGNGTNSVPVSISVSNLLNGTNYHFRMAAGNRHSTHTGSDANFTTLSGIPTATTGKPTDAGATTIRLNGSVIPNGANASAWFEWGATTNYGNVTAVQALGGGTTAANFSQVVTGLVAGATYHYRAVAATTVATDYGADVLFPPGFSDINAGLTAIFRSSAGWGDYDNDGRLDIVLTGSTNVNNSTLAVSQVWRNTGSGFTNINAGLPGRMTGIHGSLVAWGDYDNDGRLDILLCGLTNSLVLAPLCEVWRNTGSGFVLNTNAILPGVWNGSVAWGDYDNDGRRDILLTGIRNNGAIAQVWRNTDCGFTNINAGLPGVNYSSAAWGDYDNDGRLDILLSGQDPSAGLVITHVWRNTGSGFVNINAGLPGIHYSSVAWGDYNNDGRLDILLAGDTGGGFISQVWRNTGSGFININAGLPGLAGGSVAWGDYDNDGRLDIVLTGSTGSAQVSQIWRNTGNGFTNINADLPGIIYSSAVWGDYDNDGRLDLLLSGSTNFHFGGFISQVWRNNLHASNTVPTTPSALNLAVSNITATLRWTASADSETPAAGLTYNLRIGTAPGGSDVVSPMSGANGFRRVPQLGSAQHGLSATLEEYAVGTTYYWSVQAVDSAFAGSPFAPERSFKLLPVAVSPASTSIIPGDLNGDGIVTQAELDLVLSNYWPSSPWLQMTEPMKLPDGLFQFSLTNASAWNFSVEVTTNLMDWEFLGPAYPVYQFLDPLGTNAPQRHYRLRWP